MWIRYLIGVLMAVCLSGCAQVPQSSVTLSSSIGSDITSMQQAHKDFINYYYNGLEQRANDLIDHQYRPGLIRYAIGRDVAVFKDPATRNDSLFNAIQEAFIDNKTLTPAQLETAQSNAMAGMKIFYTGIDRKVEAERGKLIRPLKAQRRQLLDSVDANYATITRKNAVITALLSSIVDVHETQQQLLTMAGIKENVREDLGNELADISDKVEKIQGEVDDKTAQVETIENLINEFKKAIEKH